MLTVQIKTNEAASYLSRISQQIGGPAPLMAVLAHKLESLTQESFRVGGKPRWPGLAASTIKQRSKKGSWPGQILVVSGGHGLSGSVNSGSTATTAFVGAGSGKSAAYAAIHQFGGMAGRGHRAKIKARPYLPFTGKGNDTQLMPNAERAIMRLAMQYMEMVSKP